MKRTIGGKEYNFSEMAIPLDKLRFWPQNPRVYSELYSLYDEADLKNVTPGEMQERIYSIFRDRDDVRELRKKLEAELGLADPLIVQKNPNEDAYDVLEGNRRLAACKLAVAVASGEDSKQPIVEAFSTLQCEVTPDDISESATFSFLGTLHVDGKLAWDPFEIAGYMQRRIIQLQKEFPTGSNLPEKVADELNKPVGDVQRAVLTINLMRDAKETNQRKYSHYHVLVQNRATSKAIKEKGQKKERLLKLVKEWPKDRPALEFRKLLTEVGKNDKALATLYKTGNLDEAAEQARESGSFEAVYRKLHSFRTYLDEPARNRKIKYMDIASPDFNRIMYEIEQLNKIVKGIHDKLKERSDA